MMTPSEILRRSAEAYASCTSYRDVGEVVTRITSSRGVLTERQPFATHFLSPDRFRFEYYTRTAEPGEKRDRFVVWSDRGKAGSHWSLSPAADGGESLGDRLAAASGVSGGSAHTVPSLLLPAELAGSVLTRFIVEACGVDSAGTPCYKLDGMYPHVDAPRSYWIDAESFLIRRIHQTLEFNQEAQEKLARDAEESRQRFIAAHPERAREFPPARQLRAVEPFSTDCTTYYTPEFDSAIPPEVFTDPLGPHGP